MLIYVWDFHIYLRYIFLQWYLSEILDMPETFLRYAWDMTDICLRYAWGMSGICMKYCRNILEMPESFLRYALNLSGIYLIFAWDAINLPEICPRLVWVNWNITDICLRYNFNLRCNWKVCLIDLNLNNNSPWLLNSTAQTT